MKPMEEMMEELELFLDIQEFACKILNPEVLAAVRPSMLSEFVTRARFIKQFSTPSTWTERCDEVKAAMKWIAAEMEASEGCIQKALGSVP